MGVSVAIEYKPTPVFDRILAKMGPERRKTLEKAGAEDAAATTRSWLMRLAHERHATAERLTAKKTGIIQFVARHTRREEREGSNYVVVPHPMFRRAFQDVTVGPRRAGALAIPMAKDSYGHLPRTFGELFVWRRKKGAEGKDDKGAAFLARTKGKGKNQRLELLFLLYRGRILQKQDPTLLPDGDTMAKAALRGVARRLKGMLQAARSGGGEVQDG